MPSNRPGRLVIAAVMTSMLLLSACRVENPGAAVPTLAAVALVPTGVPTAVPPTIAPPEPTLTPAPTNTPAPPPRPTIEPTPAPDQPEPPQLPAGVFYDLGQATIIQARFPEDSRFRKMPVQLNGVMAVPDGGAEDGPYPVVLILHGTHPGCPVDETGVDRWPCDPEVEQPNYAGFEYLVRELAARGYVALSININGENTFGFGEPLGGERLEQIVDLHLSALAEASAGGANGFGVPLEGVADMRRLTLMGHSRGGEGANWLADDAQGGPDLASPYTYANRGYGPVNGLLLIAPAMSVFGSEGTHVPLAVVISGCDGDVADGVGQRFYEEVRLGEMPNTTAAAVFLPGANHNGYNSILGGDFLGSAGRPECETLLDPEAQRQFLVDYADAFLTMLDSPDPAARLEAARRLGLDAAAPAPAEVMGQAALVSSLLEGADRRSLFVPATEGELATNPAGVAVVAENVTTHFCEEGYSVPATNPGSDPCQRPNTTIPGYPAMAVVSWTEPDGALRFALPEGGRDLSRYTAVSLRAAVDPLSSLNTAGETQRFSVRLTDGAGRSAVLLTRPDEPALAFPVGLVRDDELFDRVFTGLAPMTTIRLPLTGVTGVDLADVVEVALVFDQTPSGNLFLGDVELVRPPGIIGANSTLLTNSDGANNGLRGVARFDGASICTGAFIAPAGPPGAPAYLLTNGHCAQEWDANRVFIDTPAAGWSATFNYFVDTAEARITVPAVRVAYSTMKGRDVAFVELDATVGELAAQGIRPFSLAAVEPPDGFEMRVVGAPVTGVPADSAFLREEGCAARGRADLFEFVWRFDDALRNSCRDIVGGSSGSPVFVAGDPAIVGLINTTNIGGITPCGLGAPCEVRPDGTVMVADTSYVTPVTDLATCFDAAGAFDPAAPGCPLDDGRQLLISGYPAQGTQNPVVAADGTEGPATWNATVAGDLPYYRYKIGRAGQVDCRVDEGYGAPIALAPAPLIDEPLPPDEGSYVLCVVAGESAAVDGTWQPVEWATAARAEVDNTPPSLEPQLSILPDGTGGFLFEPIFVVPELSDFAAKFGPAATTDCAGREDYQRYRRIPFKIPADQLPGRICVIGSDMAGNEGAPYEVVVGQ